MSSIKDYMRAASSDGNSVYDLVSATSVDANKGKKRIIDTIKWVYANYFCEFEDLTLEMASSKVTGMTEDGSVYTRFAAKFGKCELADAATINMALVWTYLNVIVGSKGAIKLCYLMESDNMSEDDYLNAHMGKMWNSFLIVDITDNLESVHVKMGANAKAVDMRVLNTGMDTYEVLLITQKER